MAANEPAFPMHCNDPKCPCLGPVSGLTKREYFACAAMQGIMTGLMQIADDGAGMPNFKAVAVDACKLADALLAELAK